MKKSCWVSGLVGLVTLVLSVQVTSGTTRYVSPSGTESGGYTNWAIASKTIQKAVNACVNGDTVWVTNGVYSFTSHIILSNGVTVAGLGGASGTIIDGGGVSRAFYLSHSNAVVDGFCIRNGSAGEYAEHGGGILMTGGGLVKNCIIRNCQASWGGGVSLNTAGGTLRNCLIVSNQATTVGEPGGGVFLQDAGILENCTVVKNQASQSAGLAVNGGSVYGVANSVIYDNVGGDNVGYYNGSPVGAISYSCFTPYIAGTGNTTNNPLFTTGFRLATNSPCINKGTNLAWVATATDLDGLSRLFAGTVDMGAYETRYDSDGDGTPDAWMLQYFGHLTGQAGDKSLAGDDPDGDGYTNLEEYQNGGNPKVFDIGSAYIWTAIEVGWKTVSGTNYQVQTITDLTSNNWVNLGSNIVGNGAITTILDSTRTNAHKFYRVVVP
jgi:hypothetical protein